MFRGTFTALVTPFKGEEIDFGALEKLMETQFAARVDGVVAVTCTRKEPLGLSLIGQDE